MSSRASLCMVIHAHQPVGNFDSVIEDAFRKSYQPFLNTLSRHPAIHLALHYSGILLEWIEQRYPAFMRQLGELTARGQIEHVTGGYFEPILAAIPFSEKVAQIRRQSDFLSSRFGVRPRGFWVTERVWEQSLVPPLADAGVEYTILDDTHFLAAGIEPSQLHQVYLTEECGQVLRLVPSLQALRYTIPFRDSEETLSILREGAGKRHALHAVGDDCEKFGVWPGTYEHCYANGWLERFFQALEAASDWLEVPALGGYLDAHPPAERVYLPTASYPEMMTWALSTKASEEFHFCLEETKTLPSGAIFRRFLRGGEWRNFLQKYSESNQLHKLLLQEYERCQARRRVAAAGSDDQKVLEQASDHLMAAACNDAYWHGIFGGLYAPHLRSALLRHFIQAETLLDGLERADANSGLRIQIKDFDVDGREEILISSSSLGMIVRPADGGTVSSLRLKSRAVELINSLTRRREPYHKLVEQQAAERQPGTDAPASIHDRIRAKESNLAALLRFDHYPRHAFRTYLFPGDQSGEQFELLQLEESTELACGPWKLLAPPAPSGEFELAYDGTVHVNHQEFRLSARKRFSIEDRDDGWAVHCGLEVFSAGHHCERFSLGTELVFNLLAPNNSDRYFLVSGERHPLEFKGEFRQSRVALVDQEQRVRIDLDAPSVRAWWIEPIETISQSEGGFERVYQGSAIMAVWDADLISPNESSCLLRMSVTSL